MPLRTEQCCSYSSIAVDSVLDIALPSPYLMYTIDVAIGELCSAGANFWFQIGNKTTNTNFFYLQVIFCTYIKSIGWGKNIVLPLLAFVRGIGRVHHEIMVKT